MINKKVGDTVRSRDVDKFFAPFEVPETFVIESIESSQPGYQKMVLSSGGETFVAEYDDSADVDSWGLWLQADFLDQAPVGVELTRDYGDQNYAICYFD
jgi:hypothetical protein